MQLSVSTFIAEFKNDLKNMFGYEQLLKDFTELDTKKAFGVSNDMISCRLLTNYYGSPCNEEICKLYRTWAYKTTFPGGEHCMSS